MTDQSSYYPYNKDHIPPVKPLPKRGVLQSFDPAKLEFVPLHVHNGQDSPKVSYNNLIDAPNVNEWIFDGVFSPSSNTTVAWSAGTLQFSDGSTFEISAGSTGVMTTVTYIYFDSSISETAFQVGTSADFGGTNNLGAASMGITFSPNGQFIYVSGASTTKRYNTNFTLLATNTTVGASGSIGVPNIAASYSFLYVADGSKVYKLNALDLTSVLETTLAIDGVILSPDGLYLYGIDNVNSRLYKLNTSDLTQATTLASTGLNPVSVGVSPNGLTVYVLVQGGGLSSIQKFTASNLAAGTLTNTSGNNAKALAVSPDGNAIYATNFTAKVDAFNTSLSLTIAGTLAGGSQPFGVTVSTDNSFVYVVDQSANRLYKLNASDLSEVTHVSVPISPSSVLASSDGSYIYVTSRNSTIRKYNASDLSLLSVAPFILTLDTIIIGVAQNVASSKNAIFEIFGGNALNGSGKLITAADTNIATLSSITPALGTITSGTLAGITGLALRDTSAAFDVTITMTSSPVLNAARTLTIDMGNVAHTLVLGTTANTITFPNVASDTVVMLTASQAITNKTYNGLSVTSTTGTLTVTNGKTLTVSDSATLATNSITFAGGEVVTFTATNALTFTTVGATNVTLPTSGTLATEGLSGTKVYYVSDTNGGATTRKLTFTNGILTAET